LLKAIAEQDALAIREIARCVKRDVRAVRSDIHALLRSLHPSAGQRRRPYQRTFRQTPRLSRQYSCSKLSKGARQDTRAKGRRRELVVSAISVFEIVTLERRGRIAFKTSVTEWLTDVRRLPELTIHPVTAEIAERAGSLGEVFPGDPADRIIAATALVLGAALITHDTKLLGVPNLETIW
jgi:PIN domain nuclease of toxin-antitoxin system